MHVILLYIKIPLYPWSCKISLLNLDVDWVVLSTAMVGKFFINIPGSVTWLYALELYPTSIRSIGVHVCSFMARIGAVGASYIGILVGTMSCLIFDRNSP